MSAINTTAQSSLDQATRPGPREGELFLDPMLDCPCNFCWGKPVIQVVAETVLARITDRVRNGHELSGDALVVLRMLARSREPIPGAAFQRILVTDERSVKAIMKDICDEWAVPVIASRKPPYGYFVAATAAEFLEWERVMRSQAIAMLARCRRLFKANFPELAGQDPLQFIEQVKSDLQEAIR